MDQEVLLPTHGVVSSNSQGSIDDSSKKSQAQQGYSMGKMKCKFWCNCHTIMDHDLNFKDKVVISGSKYI